MTNQQQLNFLYIFNFLKDTNLIHVILSPFMIYSGLQVSDYILMVSLFRLVQVVFTIPCGILADKYKPSASLRLSAVLFIISFLFLLDEKPSFIMFAMHNMISSLCICLMISSNKKLKYIIKDNEEFIEKYSYKISVRKLGLMVSGIIASLLIASLGYQGLVLLQVFLCLILVYFSFKLKEETIDSELSSNFKLKSLKAVLNTIKELPFNDMAKVIVVSVPFFVSIDVLLQPLLIEAKVPLWSFPLFIAGSNMLIFIAINKSHYLSKIFNIPPFVNSLIPLSGLLLYVLTSNPYWGLVGMILTIFSRCFSVVESALFINQIPSKKQSTIESILNALNIVGVSVLSFIYGWLVRNYNLWNASWIFLIIFLIFIGSFQFFISKKGLAIKPALD